MSDLFGGRSGGGGGLAGGLSGPVRMAAIALLVQQLTKQSRGAQGGAAPAGEGGGLGGLLGGIFGGGGAQQAPMGGTGGQFGGAGGPLGGVLGSLLGGASGGLLGGLGGLLGGLRNQGLGHHVDSWVGHGPNKPVSAQELEQGFDPQELDEAARHAGTDRGTLLQELSGMLPQVVDRMTPQGQLPQREEELGGGGLGGLLGSIFGEPDRSQGPGRR